MKTAQAKFRNCNIQQVLEAFRREYSPKFEHGGAAGNNHIMVVEKFNFWQNSDMSLIASFDWEGAGDAVTVTLVVAGGKTGLLRLDILGREKANLDKVVNFFRRLASEQGFSIGS